MFMRVLMAVDDAPEFLDDDAIALFRDCQTFADLQLVHCQRLFAVSFRTTFAT